VVDWGQLPEIGVVTVLVCAFASVSRQSHAPLSSLWLTGWIMIVLHFVAFMFLPTPGILGTLALFLGLSALVWAGVLFMWAAVPYRHKHLSLLMLVGLLLLNSTYIALIAAQPSWNNALTLVAALIGIFPLAITLPFLRQINHPHRWTLVGLYASLSAFLLVFQHRPGNGVDMAENALLFTVYSGCALLFWESHRRATVGAVITTAGFFAWASVFVIAPLMEAFTPQFHVESEVWNLPKYLVAVGMILLLLEAQIERSIYLALHDELTGLPNRRLFQDRLASALERARRSSSQAALMVIDLDHFKEVNDTMGHHTGDLLLQHVASVFTSRIRHSDTVARTGGDEFSMILESPISHADADLVGESLLQLLKEPLMLENHAVRIGASFGIAIFPQDAQDMESLFIAADLRMYDEKHEATRQVTADDFSLADASET